MDARAFRPPAPSVICSELTSSEQTGDEAEMDSEGYIKVVFLASYNLMGLPLLTVAKDNRPTERLDYPRR